MVYRNIKIERSVLGFLKSLPPELLKFPFDIHKAVKTMSNCTIHSYQMFALKFGTSVQKVAEDCQSETGCTHKYNDKYMIMYNNDEQLPNERRKYTIAHELGHIILGHHEIKRKQQIAQNDKEDKVMEREADYFAACVLCPMPLVYILKLRNIYQIRRRFGLSYKAAEIAWNDYCHYDRSYDIAWHNDMIKLLSPHFE